MENLNKIDQFFKEENKKFEENISFPDFENVWGVVTRQARKRCCCATTPWFGVIDIFNLAR